MVIMTRKPNVGMKINRWNHLLSTPAAAATAASGIAPAAIACSAIKPPGSQRPAFSRLPLAISLPCLSPVPVLCRTGTGATLACRPGDWLD